MSQLELASDLTRRAKAASERVAELATDVKDAALRLAVAEAIAADENGRREIEAALKKPEAK